MKESIEILFDECRFNDIKKYIVESTKKANLVKCNGFTDNIPYGEFTLNLMTESSILSYLEKENECGNAYFHFTDFELSVYNIPFIVLCVMKYDNVFRLEFNFDLEFLTMMKDINQLQLWVQNLGDKIGAKSYVCGLEPASYEQTRFFTNIITGPLNFTHTLKLYESSR
jgi:hypothetical protein